MDFESVNAIASLLGYITLVVGAAVLGSAALSYIQSLPARINKAVAECVIIDDGMAGRCVEHGCDAIDQCGKLACPHCCYKFDDIEGAYGYPAPGADPRDANSYAGHTNYNTGEPCRSEEIREGETPLDAMKRMTCANGEDHTLADCIHGCPPSPGRRPDADCVTRPDCDNGGACMPPSCGRPPMSDAACHPDCDPDDPEDRKRYRVRFVDPATMDWDSDREGLREVREHLPNGDIIHYVRGRTEHKDESASQLTLEEARLLEASSDYACSLRECDN